MSRQSGTPHGDRDVGRATSATSRATKPPVDPAPWIAYEYAFLRVVPRAHRSEHVAVGVVLFARTVDFLELRTRLDLEALAARWPYLDREMLDLRLEACRLVGAGGASAGPIGRLPASERFHWLTTPRSAVVRASPVHGGLTTDPAATLARLMRDLPVSEAPVADRAGRP